MEKVTARSFLTPSLHPRACEAARILTKGSQTHHRVPMGTQHFLSWLMLPAWVGT